MAPLPDLASVFPEPTAPMWDPLHELYSLESFLASGMDDGYLTLCKLSPRGGGRANESSSGGRHAGFGALRAGGAVVLGGEWSGEERGIWRGEWLKRRVAS